MHFIITVRAHTEILEVDTDGFHRFFPQGKLLLVFFHIVLHLLSVLRLESKLDVFKNGVLNKCHPSFHHGCLVRLHHIGIASRNVLLERLVKKLLLQFLGLLQSFFFSFHRPSYFATRDTLTG